MFWAERVSFESLKLCLLPLTPHVVDISTIVGAGETADRGPKCISQLRLLEKKTPKLADLITGIHSLTVLEPGSPRLVLVWSAFDEGCLLGF